MDREIARDAWEYVTVESHRTLLPVLQRLRGDGYRLVGLEQATGSHCLYDYRFVSRTVLVVGHERHGLAAELLTHHGRCRGNPGLRSTGQSQRRDGGRHRHVRVLSAVSAGLTVGWSRLPAVRVG